MTSAKTPAPTASGVVGTLPFAIASADLVLVMNEWMRQFTEEPETFEAQFRTVGRFLEEQSSGQMPTYGQHVVAFVEELAAQLNLPLERDLDPADQLDGVELDVSTLGSSDQHQVEVWVVDPRTGAKALAMRYTQPGPQVFENVSPGRENGDDLIVNAALLEASKTLLR